MSTRKRSQLIEALIVQMRRFIADAILTNQQIADRAGLNLTDQQTLNLLDLQGPATPGELARLTGLTTGGVTVVLDRLETAGYITRKPIPHDRRSIIVHVVPAQLRQLKASYRSINRQLDHLFAGYDRGDLEIVLAFFSKTNAVRNWMSRPKRNRDRTTVG